MEVMDAIKKRRSIRRFSDKNIDDNVIKEIIELGNLAPSAGNLQPRDFIIVRDQNIKNDLAMAALNQDFMAQAPVVIAVCANLKRTGPYGSRGRELYCIQDSAASIENMLLAIVDKGLASCWIGAFNEGAVSRILKVPDHIRPVAMLPIGYSDIEERATSRVTLDDLIHYEKW